MFFLSLHDIDSILIRKTDTFQCVLDTNKIKTLDLRHHCTLGKIQLIVDLFPQLKYLLLNRHNNIPHLFFFDVFAKYL